VALDEHVAQPGVPDAMVTPVESGEFAAAGGGRTVAVIGMDGTSEALDAVKRGGLSATVAQYPFAIGQLGVEACLATIRGKPVPANILAPVQLVTPENVARAQASFPRPVEPFDDVLAQLLNP